MHLGFRVLHHAEGVPELDCMFFTVVPWTTFPQAVVSHAAVLQQSDDVCIFVSTRPTDHRTFAVCHRLPHVAQELAPRFQQRCSVLCRKRVLQVV